MPIKLFGKLRDMALGLLEKANKKTPWNLFDNLEEDIEADLGLTVTASIDIDLVSDDWSTNDFAQVRHVSGDLMIRFNMNLENLDFLKTLESVQGDLVLFGNPCLSDIEGLKNLKRIDGHFVVIGNNALTDLTALNETLQIGGNLKVIGNPLTCYGPILKYEPGGEAEVVVDTLNEFVMPHVVQMG